MDVLGRLISVFGAASATFGQVIYQTQQSQTNKLRVNPNSNPQTEEGGAPPTYDSLYGRIKEAKQEHGTGFQFFKAVAIILSAVIGGNL